MEQPCTSTTHVSGPEPQATGDRHYQGFAVVGMTVAAKLVHMLCKGFLRCLLTSSDGAAVCRSNSAAAAAAWLVIWSRRADVLQPMLAAAAMPSLLLPHQHTRSLPTPNAPTLLSPSVPLLSVVIDSLYDELDDLEDELELAAEEAYLTEAALEEADGAGDGAAGGQTMADLETRKP